MGWGPDILLEKDNTVTVHQRNVQLLAIEMFKFAKKMGPEIMRDFLFCIMIHEVIEFWSNSLR